MLRLCYVVFDLCNLVMFLFVLVREGVLEVFLCLVGVLMSLCGDSRGSRDVFVFGVVFFMVVV